MSKIEVDAIEPQSGTTLTIGASGDTITIPAGATLTGSGASLAWQSVQTTGFTAVKGNAYPCNTTSAGFTVTLPATPSAGDQVQLVDYAGTFDTNQLIIDPNGEDIEGETDDLTLRGEREGVILTYIDSTQGWIATSGINEGTDALEPNTYLADFLVIAGGGAGGSENAAGGGGAGGYRTSYSTSGGGASAESKLILKPGTVYTITIGGGGAIPTFNTGNGGNGGISEISGTGITTITSAGGGGGSGNAAVANTGGSGGGGADQTPYNTGANGTANQGFKGGNAAGTNLGYNGGGGGGAGAVGFNASGGPGGNGGNGGTGLASSITGSSVTRGGGAGGCSYNGTVGTGTGGGGNGSRKTATVVNGTAGTVNTGGGGGAGADTTSARAYTGGSGVVILRMPDAKYSGTTTGSPTVDTDVGGSGETVIIFNSSGSYTG